MFSYKVRIVLNNYATTLLLRKSFMRKLFVHKIYDAKFIKLICVCSLLTFTVAAQQERVPRDPIRIIDAATGQTIPEALILPVYKSGSGVAVTMPEYKSMEKNHRYLKNPFIYKAGEKLEVKRPPTFIGLPLLVVAIGKTWDVDGLIVVAKGYAPFYWETLWSGEDYNMNVIRTVKLTPVTEVDWKTFEESLKPLASGTEKANIGCNLATLTNYCPIDVNFSKKMKKTVQKFLK
jgi:hypothetical protein